MPAFDNPAVNALVRELGNEQVFGEVLIRPAGRGWELRHAADRAVAAEALRELDLAETRPLAQFTGNGAFRPLKSAPNLARGWWLSAATEVELGEALERFYPGAVADWFAVRQGTASPTDYRAFTARQTGMYRITTFLDDAQAADMVRACCHRDFCLKRRLWSVGALLPDSASEKSVIPCLEPCAVLLEFARSIARLTKDNALPLPASVAEARAELQQTDAALAQPDPSVRAADFAAPANPRRLRWLREKLARVVSGAERPA
jgi:4Fe-4S iron-sulfur cluster binding domain/DR2241 stabilising domain